MNSIKLQKNNKTQLKKMKKITMEDYFLPQDRYPAIIHPYR